MSNDIKQRLNPSLPMEAKLLVNKLKKGRILRYKIDIFSVFAVIAAVIFQFSAYWYKWPWYSLFPLLILLRAAHLVEHNHAHLPIFKNNFLNEAIGWLMFLNCGIPLQSYREQHVKAHHHGLGTSDDWTSPWSYQGAIFPTKPINKVYYYSVFMITSIFQCAVIYLKKPLSKSTIYFVVSTIVVSVAMTWLAWHDTISFFIYYLLPWVITYIHLAIANWKHHVNCEYSSVYTTSMNDFNIDSCKLGFNIGYHTAHHWYPTLHWSLLEEFHHRFLAPHIPERYYVPLWFSSWFTKKYQKKCKTSDL